LNAGRSESLTRIVVTGSECTGKTTLAEALAQHYDTVCVPEFVRDFVAEHGRPPEFGDVDEIARGQIAREDELAAGASRLLVLDTDLLSTVVYSRHYYGACPSWIENELASRRCDLYLLADIDVPWSADGFMRDRGDRREEMHALFRNALRSRGERWMLVRGAHDLRMQNATRAIDLLLRE
jgi:NadR type nicotinamide-nucleotide adenylyltransferase